MHGLGHNRLAVAHYRLLFSLRCPARVCSNPLTCIPEHDGSILSGEERLFRFRVQPDSAAQDDFGDLRLTMDAARAALGLSAFGQGVFHG